MSKKINPSQRIVFIKDDQIICQNCGNYGQKIDLNKRTRTKVAIVLRTLHKELSSQEKLIGDYKYFEIIRLLNSFSTDSDTEIYKALTR